MSDFGITFKDLQGRTIDPKLGLGEVPLKYIAHLESLLTAEREAREKAEDSARLLKVENVLLRERAESAERDRDQWKERSERRVQDIQELAHRLESAEQRIREAMEQEPIGEKSLNGIEWQHALTVDLMEVGTKLYAAPIPPADVTELQKAYAELRMQKIDIWRENKELTRTLAAFEATRQRVIAGALYDLFGWLTTRRTAITLSDKHDAGIAADTLVDFAKMRGLSLDDPLIESWQVVRDGKEELTKLLDESRKQEREECAKICESLDMGTTASLKVYTCATAIRAKGN